MFNRFEINFEIFRWPQAWDHCVAPNMGPLRGPKHGTTAWPQTWDLTNTPSMGGGHRVCPEET